MKILTFELYFRDFFIFQKSKMQMKMKSSISQLRCSQTRRETVLLSTISIMNTITSWRRIKSIINNRRNKLNELFFWGKLRKICDKKKVVVSCLCRIFSVVVSRSYSNGTYK